MSIFEKRWMGVTLDASMINKEFLYKVGLLDPDKKYPVIPWDEIISFAELALNDKQCDDSVFIRIDKYGKYELFYPATNEVKSDEKNTSRKVLGEKRN